MELLCYLAILREGDLCLSQVTAFKFRDPEGHPLEMLAFALARRLPIGRAGPATPVWASIIPQFRGLGHPTTATALPSPPRSRLPASTGCTKSSTTLPGHSPQDRQTGEALQSARQRSELPLSAVPGKEKKRIAVDALSLQAVVTLLLARGVVAAPLLQRMSPGLHGECGPAILPHERRGPENSLPVPQIRALFLRLPAVRRKGGGQDPWLGCSLPSPNPPPSAPKRQSHVPRHPPP